MKHLFSLHCSLSLFLLTYFIEVSVPFIIFVDFYQWQISRNCIKKGNRIILDNMVILKAHTDNEKILLVMSVGSSAHANCLKILPAYHQCGTTLL